MAVKFKTLKNSGKMFKLLHTSVPSGTGRALSSLALVLARLGGTTVVLDVLDIAGAESPSPFIRLDWLLWLPKDMSPLLALPVLPEC